MSSRRIDNPGIELNEIDRSQYDKVDYSLPNAPAVLTYGFADKGEDGALVWINSKSTLDSTYGLPTNEYESYFYNSICEVLNRGGTCIAAKMPYDNESTGKYNYVDLSVSTTLIDTFGVTDISNLPSDFKTIQEIRDSMYAVLSSNVFGSGTSIYKEYYNKIDTIQNMHNCLSIMLETKPLDEELPLNTINDIKEALYKFILDYYSYIPFSLLSLNDNTLTSYLSIGNCCNGADTMQQFDNYITNSQAVLQNHIRIYDITRAQYESLDVCTSCVVETYKNEQDTDIQLSTGNCLGIVPIIVTPANALYFQQLINLDIVNLSKIDTFAPYNPVSYFSTEINTDLSNRVSIDFTDINQYLQIPLSSQQDNALSNDGSQYESLSRIASLQFPQIQFLGTNRFDPTYMKHIGVVVFKAFKDVDNNGKLNFELLESFVGSLNKTARDPVTKANAYIDDIVNSRSKYIRLFSNVNQKNLEKASTVIASQLSAVSLGFYDVDCHKTIHYVNSVMKPLTQLLDTASNKNAFPIDIVVDAGMSNIAKLARMTGSGIDADKYPSVANLNERFSDDPNTRATSIAGWKAVLTKLDSFCKYSRKDCMFIADGLRDMCLDGNVKLIRKTCPSNTVANTIIPRFRTMTNVLNSSYSAGYCNWFYQQDYGDSSGTTYFWVPPSIKAAGAYIYCDTYFHPWSAPAGQTRGIMRDVVDVAFIPLDEDAGKIYSNQWNYAMSYPLDGITIEGHKTFQTQKTALDRVNVRRLMLYLEKRVERIARNFVYESNTAYTRQLFVDAVRQVFEDAVAGDGVKEYGIKCDEELNTIDVIENNEMRCKIAVKPVKCVDYIVIDFICTRQNAVISEELVR